MLVAMLLAAQAAQPSPEPANWECADRLIERNYAQRFTARELGRRIAEECMRPFQPPQAVPYQVQNARIMYNLQAQDFLRDVQSAIESRRLRARIRLNR